MIIALAGRRIDAPDATTPSFPPENVDTVRQRILDAFVGHEARALVSSAACGADLLALAAARELALRRHVILPFEPKRFREASVIDRPGNWGSIYDIVIAEVKRSGDLVIVNSRAVGDEVFVAVNISILDEAAALARESDDRVLAVLVWDGISRDGTDVTNAFDEEVRKRNLPFVEVKTL